MNRPYNILVIDDEPDFYDTFFALDAEWNRLKFTPKEDGSRFIQSIDGDFDAIFLDLEIPHVSSFRQGIEYLSSINRELNNAKPIIVVTKDPNLVDTYQKALNNGAAGFFPKEKYNRAIYQQLTRKIIEQFRPIPQSPLQVFSQSTWLQKEYDSFVQILKKEKHVFTILGEIGTGKRYLVKYLEKNIPISTISINAQDFKTKLSIKGRDYKVITGIETANEETQEMLEQWLKKKPKAIFLCDDRIKQAYLNGQLSPNLYALIMQNVIKLPSLVERPNDIEPFIDQFLLDPRNCPRHLEFFGKKATQVFTQEALNRLKQYKWKGNVRELRSTIQRAICQADMDNFGTRELKKVEVDLLPNRVKEDDYRHIAKIEAWSYEKIRADQRLKEIEQVCINEVTIPEIAVKLNCTVEELVNELRESRVKFPEFFDHKNLISKRFKADFSLSENVPDWIDEGDFTNFKGVFILAADLAQKLIDDNIEKHQRGEDAAYLDLGRCGLTTLPDLSPLIWLETLVVSNQWWDWEKEEWIESINTGKDNQLKEKIQYSLPVNLKQLIFCGNKADIEASRYEVAWDVSNLNFLQNLIQLKYLDISYHPYANDLEFLRNLTNLQYLNLRDNRIISDYRFLHDLTQLQILNLSSNEIKDEVEFLLMLPQLNTLDLSNNQISDGEFLRSLSQINNLDLRGNQITNLEPILHLIQKGIQVTLNPSEKHGINLYNNPLFYPRVEIVEQGNVAILDYFEELKKSNVDQIYEAKLLLIGEGEAGKTSLCRKLIDPTAELPQVKDRTLGIDIQTLYFDVPGMEDKQFRLNIWDFAGQGKYQSVHSFFYTHNSLYIFVDDTNTFNDNNAYDTLYNNWLQLIELFGGNSPVVILHNERNGFARNDFKISKFKERFEFLHGDVFCINLGGKETDKLIDLKNQIQRLVLKLSHIGDTIPKSWVGVREAIERERTIHPYIPIENYQKLCEQKGISDTDTQMELSRYLHNIGVFLHYQDHQLLRRDVFLQNQWVADAVYKVLDDSQIATTQLGRFKKEDLARLWQEKNYRDRQDELLALMLKFELCYQIQDTTTYICPQLLPSDIPSYDLGTTVPLKLKYEFGFMPKGMFYRLIVRLYRHIAQTQTAVWNSGVVLEREGAKLEIIGLFDNQAIEVRAAGQRFKELMNIFHGHVEDLHASFGDRLKVQIKIPCNCNKCIESNFPHFYDKKSLEARRDNGKTTVECDVSYDKVDIQGLLEGIFVKGISSQNSTKQNLVIRYAPLDKPYLEAFKIHLSPLRQQNLIEIWDDTNLVAGQEWATVTDDKLDTANIIVFLVSAYLTSTADIWNKEIPKALERHKQEAVRIIPIIIRECDWKNSLLGELTALPKEEKPVSKWLDQDEAWTQVVAEIRALLK